MSRVKIEWLSDSIDCETCGGNYADGACVWIDDKLIEDFIPSAHCFDGQSWSQEEIYHFIIAKLGHTIEENV